MNQQLNQKGYCVISNLLKASDLEALISASENFSKVSVDIRKNVFEHSVSIKEIFSSVRDKLDIVIGGCIMTDYCFYLEKTTNKNWPLKLHQDFNFPDYLNLSKEEEEHWLTNGFWVRVNLDANNRDTGALKVIPQSHLKGRHSSFNPEDAIFVEVEAGDIVLFKPLLYHSSDKMKVVGQRRVFQCFFLGNWSFS